jgi:divalent metal cation (Fe/Co/Zn/Cd) transporter
MVESSNRVEATRAAVRWSGASLAYSVLVGGVSLVVGTSSGSTALVGFGLNSVIDGVASAVLFRRFSHDLAGKQESHELERRAVLFVGAVLILAAIYIAARGAVTLAEGEGPEASFLGVAIPAVSLFVLPVFSHAKLRLAGELDSRALKADGVLSGAGAGLAAAALIGLTLSSALDWTWADSVAAILIAGMLLREGLLTLRSQRPGPD